MTYIPHKQRGMANIMTTLVLLMVMTSMTLYATSTSKTEVLVSTNETLESQAFESAEAGLEYARSYINANSLAMLVDSDNDGFIDAVNDPNITSGTLETGHGYVFSLSNPIANNFDMILITSTGTTSDTSTARTVRQLYSLQTALNDSGPAAGLISYGGINLGGNVLINNPSTQYSIWAGGNVGFTGSAGSNNGSGDVSDRNGLGNDVDANDTQLSNLTGDEFFEVFFTGDKAEIRNMATSYYSNTGNTNYSSALDGKTGQIIWIDQDGEAQINSNVTIGSPTEPVILIVNGDFVLNGNATVYGMVYVTQDWNNTGGGTLNVEGAVVVEGNVSGNGTPNVVYNTTIITNLASSYGSFASIPGSWRDF